MPPPPQKNIKNIQRKKARSLRLNNPDNYENDSWVIKDKRFLKRKGKNIKGKTTWTKSNNYLKLENELKELQRLQASKRKYLHNVLANKVLENGNDIIIEKNLSGNENNMQSLLLIYTPKHPKVIQAYELQESLEHQLELILEQVIVRKVFELSNLKNFIDLSKEDLENAKNALKPIREKIIEPVINVRITAIIGANIFIIFDDCALEIILGNKLVIFFHPLIIPI